MSTILNLLADFSNSYLNFSIQFEYCILAIVLFIYIVGFLIYMLSYICQKIIKDITIRRVIYSCCGIVLFAITGSTIITAIKINSLTIM